MPEKRCWRCGEIVEYDKNDLRPYIYHDCRDGESAGLRNPNFWEKKVRRKYYPQAERKPKKTIWQEFG